MAEEKDILMELAVKLGLVSDKESFEKGEKLLDGLKEGLEYFAGFEAVKGLFELVESTMEGAVQAKHLAEKLGVTIEAVQELSYAADVTGSSVEDMRVSMQHLAFGMEAASKTGKGPLMDALNKLHIPLKNLKDEKLDQNLEEIAEKFKSAGPEVNKTALAIEIFGRKGTTLLPLLNKGADGIKELRAEFVELGAETTGEQAERLEELEEGQKKLKYMWGGIKSEVVMALLPTLQELAKSLFEWVKANRELIATSLVTLIRAVATAAEGLAVAIGVVAKIFEFIAQDDDAVQAALMGIAAAIGFVVVESIALAIANAWWAWIPIAIAAVAYALMKIIKLVQQFHHWISENAVVVLALGHVLSIAFGPIAMIISAIVTAVSYLTEKWDDLTSAVQRFIDKVVSIPTKAWDWIKDHVDEVGNFLVSMSPTFGAAAAAGVGASQAASLPPDGNAPSNNTTNVNIEQHIHPTEGMSEERVGDIAGQKVADAVRQAHADAGLKKE